MAAPDGEIALAGVAIRAMQIAAAPAGLRLACAAAPSDRAKAGRLERALASPAVGAPETRPNETSTSSPRVRRDLLRARHPAHTPDNRGDYHELDDNDRAHCPGYGERIHTGRGPCGDGHRIDLIFATRNRIHERRSYGTDTMNVPTSCGGLCSDHRPVRGHVRVLIRAD